MESRSAQPRGLRQAQPERGWKDGFGWEVASPTSLPCLVDPAKAGAPLLGATTSRLKEKAGSPPARGRRFWVEKQLSVIVEIEIDQLRDDIVIEIHNGFGNPELALRGRQGRHGG